MLGIYAILMTVLLGQEHASTEFISNKREIYTSIIMMFDKSPDFKFLTLCMSLIIYAKTRKYIQNKMKACDENFL